MQKQYLMPVCVFLSIDIYDNIYMSDLLCLLK